MPGLALEFRLIVCLENVRFGDSIAQGCFRDPHVQAPGAAAEDRPLVADECASAAREDRWPFGQTRPLLLADAGGESSARRLFGSMVRRIAALSLPAG